jgi:hypothetical protein
MMKSASVGRWYRSRRDGEDGMALVLVVASMLILTMFASAALAYAVGSRPLSRHDQDFNGALTAAQAGIDDYIRHLNQDDSYWQLTPSPPDCSNVSLMGPSMSGCLYAPTVQFAYVNDDGNTKGPAFHVDVDPSGLGGNGSTLSVTSTGRVNGVTRTLQADVGRSGSTAFVYYTDFEVADPANVVSYPDGEPSDKRCITEHWWEGRNNASGCAEITFIGGDVLNGPVHTNDTPLMTDADGKAPEFKGYQYYPLSLESSDPACKSGKASNNYAGCYRNDIPTLRKPAGWAKVLPLQDNADQMKTYPGCDYVGQTRIVFTSDGYMNVWSKDTNSTNSSTTATCGGNAPWGTRIPVPDAEVIYVGDAGSAHQCQANEIAPGLPVAGDVNMAQADQLCGKGNAYIQGTLLGRVTVAAQNSIVITGDLTLQNPNSNDLLGLVASNSVEIMHPWIVNFTRNAGRCQSTSSAWQGENWTQKNDGTWAVTPGKFVKQPKDSKGNPELWQPGTWVQTAGIWSWTPGQWFTPSSSSQRSVNYGYSGGAFGKQCSSGSSWQGESWDDSYSESSTWPVRSQGKDILVYASIQTLQHSFYVQSYNEGAVQGSVIVYGSIAQKYRGAVGSGSLDWRGNFTPTHGYLKSYNYDQRLHSRAPPYFPQWLGAAWSTKRLGEIAAKY